MSYYTEEARPRTCLLSIWLNFRSLNNTQKQNQFRPLGFSLTLIVNVNGNVSSTAERWNKIIQGTRLIVGSTFKKGTEVTSAPEKFRYHDYLLPDF
jgi:hypothetical protein